MAVSQKKGQKLGVVMEASILLILLILSNFKYLRLVLGIGLGFLLESGFCAPLLTVEPSGGESDARIKVTPARASTVGLL